MQTCWPEYEQSWHAYNAAAFSPKPPKATPKDIDRYFLALDISLAYCDTEQRRLIWAVNYSAVLRNGYIRERGPAWEKLSKMSKDRISAKRVKANYLDAIVKLAYRMKLQIERLTQKVITNYARKHERGAAQLPRSCDITADIVSCVCQDSRFG